MTLVSSGQISAGVSSPANQSINTELGKAYNAQLSLNDTDARALAGITGSGTQISYSSFYGKSSRNSYYITFTTSHSDATVSAADTTSGSYVAGSTDVYITVNSGVYLWASSISTIGLTISGANTGDTVSLINNGYIIGKGGNGAIIDDAAPGSNGENGGTALSIFYNISITNNGYIAGGGGGGGAPLFYDSYYCCGAGMTILDFQSLGGGGGAGGGTGGLTATHMEYPTSFILTFAWGGSGGVIGAAGANGGSNSYGGILWHFGGGGGGRIVPGTGGTVHVSPFYAGGGGAGGSGGFKLNTDYNYWDPSGNGGSANSAGSSGTGYSSGGGGGWGAAGGNASLTPSYYYYNCVAGAGGKAINLNGKTVTWVSGSIRAYGAVS
jgi:hypothetical protein